jgi:hypothetical protein
MTYPIFVERFQGVQSVTVVCTLCTAERLAEMHDVDLDGGGPCPDDKCGGWTTFKYLEVDKCAGCGKLGQWEPALARCCSRRCALQAEYAESLHARARTRVTDG